MVERNTLQILLSTEWVTHFQTLLNRVVEVNKEHQTSVTQALVDHEASCNLCLSNAPDELNCEISTEEVDKCIGSLPKGKAADMDGLVNEMYKAVNTPASKHQLSSYLKTLFNRILETGVYPKDWCVAILSPLHKGGDVNEPNNFKGILLLSTMSKIFTKIINKRLVSWAENQGLKYEEQAGYRQGYSTVDQVFVLQSVVQKYTTRPKGRFYVAFIDFSKAFDTIPHSLLFYKLIKSGVHGNVLHVLQSMYKHLKSCVRSKDSLTECFQCNTGTRHGCMLSPFLFTLYINELIDMLRQCKGVYIDET